MTRSSSIELLNSNKYNYLTVMLFLNFKVDLSICKGDRDLAF